MFVLFGGKGIATILMNVGREVGRMVVQKLNLKKKRKKEKKGKRIIDTKNKISIICPYCGYNFDEDIPDISWETEKYMIDNNFHIPVHSRTIFNDELYKPAYKIKDYCCYTFVCYKCTEKFIVQQEITYSTEKIEG